jgi:hypothetical protein
MGGIVDEFRLAAVGPNTVAIAKADLARERANAVRALQGVDMYTTAEIPAAAAMDRVGGGVGFTPVVWVAITITRAGGAYERRVADSGQRIASCVGVVGAVRVTETRRGGVEFQVEPLIEKRSCDGDEHVADEG